MQHGLLSPVARTARQRYGARMKRVCEPELMDDDVQARAYHEADFDAAHEAFVDRFLDRFGPVAGSTIDLGCGAADVTVRWARRNPQATILGLDGAPSMLHYGRDAVRAAGLEARVRLEEQRLPFAVLEPGFDTVISNSLLHHLHEPAQLWEAVLAVAAPGARVFVMDLRRPPSRATAQAMVDQTAATEPEILRRDFLASLCAAFEPGEVRAQLEQHGLGALRVEPVGDRHLVVWGRLDV